MTHSELCELSCKHFIKNFHVGLWEYQSFSTSEFPDVLMLGTGPSMLLEIKTSRSDFLADSKKTARIKYITGNSHIHVDYALERIRDINKRIGEFEYVADKKTRYQISRVEKAISSYGGHYEYIEKPHLGATRFFVCENEIIKPEDLPVGWGLFWVKNGRFAKKVDSKRFRPNMMMERDIVVHALRQFANTGNNKNHIMIKPY